MGFLKIEERFNQLERYEIENISNENPGVITLKKEHDFVREDFIQIDELVGMDGISSEEIRPVCKVENKKIYIENTELYSAYGGGGYVMGVNFPKLNKYTSWKNQFNKPSFNTTCSEE